MDNSKNPLFKPLQEIVGTNVNISESPKTRAKKEQEMFCSIVDLWDGTWRRNHKLFDEFTLDFSGYDTPFYEMIEQLFIMCYGEFKTEIVSWWVYERFLEDGELAILVDENEKEHELKTSQELFKFIKSL